MENLLFTGKRGASKTLTAVTTIIEDEAYNARPLFLYGVKDYNIERHEEITGIRPQYLTTEEVMDWRKHVPVGSVIFIDEVQKLWRARKTGAEVPIGVQEIEESRHHGVDFVFTAQFPQQMDMAVRQLVDRHIHSQCKKGTSIVRRYEWDDVRYVPISQQDKDESIKSTDKIKDTYFGMYHSADVHTKTARIPKKLYVVIAAFCLVLFLLFNIKSLIFGDKPTSDTTELATDAAKSISEALTATQGHVANEIDFTTEEGIIFALTPAIAGKPETAPIYSHLHKAVDMPKVQCLVLHRRSENECRCYNQQDNWERAIPDRLCYQYVADGYPFDYTKLSRPVTKASKAREGEKARPSPTRGGRS